MKGLKLIALLTVVIMAFTILSAGCATPATTQQTTAASTTASQAETTTTQATSTVSDDKPLAGMRIAVAHITLYDEWCKAVADELVKQGKELGAVEVNVQDPNFELEQQVKQVENFITQKYDLMVMCPTDTQGILPTLDKVAAAGIPVIEFGQTTTHKDSIAQIMWDFAQTGVMCADWAAEYAKKNLGGKIKIGMLEMLSVPVNKARSDAFKPRLEELLGKENVTYVFEQDYGSSREDAAKVVQNNIAKPVDIIWAVVDNAAFGARVALETNSIKGTIVISNGAWGTEPFSTILKNDPYYAMCIAVPPDVYVRKIYENAVKYSKGEKIDEVYQNIDTAVVDATNIKDYEKYIDPNAGN